ncbi:hypothetical protein [Baaleninema simplex]|uniref:hypothetical protein n=1 Tax=Baaleninema simplex TaxID=2862350 RepID=UPI00034886EF|nr:hypothetical protein [Baaleninema simplex]
MSVTKLTSFKIEFTGPNQHLYSNGNQQLSVTVIAQKTVDGNYVDLTPEEKNSIRVAERSENINAPLPPNWYSDTQQNGFTEGSYSGAPFARRSLDEAPEETHPIQTYDDSNPNVAVRYLRTTDTASRQFMGTIMIEGTKYTTNMASYNQYLKVTPTAPYKITVDRLQLNRDDAFNYEYSKDESYDVDIYYWTLPNLTVKQESFSGAGYRSSKLEFCFAKVIDSSVRDGAAIKKDVTSLTLGDIYGSSHNSGANIPLSSSGSYMRALRILITGRSTSPTYSNNLSWTIVDNYGCTHKFILRAAANSDYNTLSLTNG